jgi:hypothetical protein
LSRFAFGELTTQQNGFVLLMADSLARGLIKVRQPLGLKLKSADLKNSLNPHAPATRGGSDEWRNMREDGMMGVLNYAAMAFLIGVIPASLAGGYFISQNVEHLQINVVSKERLMKVSSSEGNTKTSFENFVYTDTETFKVEDNLWHWHFRAGTVYAQIHEGATCNVTVVGYRWGFLSMYQNIIAANCK